MPELPRNDFAERIYHEEHDPNYLVIKSNILVQQTRYGARMPLEDMKVLDSLIRSIKPDQKSLTIRFNTRQFIQMLGIQSDSNNFAHIKTVIRHVSKDNFWIHLPDGTYRLWEWLQGAEADPYGRGDGTFIIKFNPLIKKYLFRKRHSFETIYKFSDIMLMRSRYSPRLYEIFRSNQSKQKVQKRGLDYSINELKYDLDLMYYNKQTDKVKHDKDGHILYMYPRYADFKRYVIQPAVREINKNTEFNIRVRPLKPHRKVVGFNVALLKKNKQELAERDARIFFKIHHIPKAKQPYWREDKKHRGKFYQVNRRRKALPPKYKREGPSPKDYKNMRKAITTTAKKHPFRVMNMGGDKVEYYNPFVHKLYWSNRAVRQQFKKTWDLLNKNKEKDF